MATVTTLPRKKSWQTAAQRRSFEAQMAVTRERVMAQMLRLREMHPQPDGKPMPQEEAAHKAGISSRTWQRWESGASVPYPKNLGNVAEKFGVSIAFFETAPPVKLATPDPFAAMNGQSADAPEWALRLFHKLDERLDLILDAVNDLAEPAPDQEEPPSEQESA